MDDISDFVAAQRGRSIGWSIIGLILIFCATAPLMLAANAPPAPTLTVGQIDALAAQLELEWQNAETRFELGGVEASFELVSRPSVPRALATTRCSDGGKIEFVEPAVARHYDFTLQDAVRHEVAHVVACTLDPHVFHDHDEFWQQILAELSTGGTDAAR